MDTGRLVRGFFEDVMSQGRLEVSHDIPAADYVEHALAPFGTQEPGPVPGPEHLRATAQWLREQVPDLRMVIEWRSRRAISSRCW